MAVEVDHTKQFHKLDPQSIVAGFGLSEDHRLSRQQKETDKDSKDTRSHWISKIVSPTRSHFQLMKIDPEV
jgi:hypothetical protein